MTFTANGKRQTAKMKLLPSLVSCVYSRVKLFVFSLVENLACVAGRRKDEKGSKRPRENWEERRRERPARTLLFSSFFKSTRRTQKF